MVAYVKKAVAGVAKGTPAPRALVLGALGRCGGGAAWFAEQVGIDVTKWDLAETKKGGPFHQLLTYPILVNAIYLSEKIPSFLTTDLLDTKERQLDVFVDVSCDYTNPNNPFPIYHDGTTLVDPLLTLPMTKGTPLDVIAIDHLPSLIPSDSSRDFATDLFPHLLTLKTPGVDEDGVWTRAEKLFNEKVELL